ncbi:MAG: UGSC family (seleno)protein [Acidimicrobiia bacterium]
MNIPVASAAPVAPTVTIRRPTAPPAPEQSAPTFTLDGSIAGKHVGFRADHAWRSWQFIAQLWAERLAAMGATSELVITDGQVGDAGEQDRKEVERLAATSDVLMVGLGTCGSCTSFTIADAVTIEEHEKPVIALVCDEFATHGANMARHLGHGDLKILVMPYPLEARPEDELRAIADDYFAKALELLGVQA